LSINSLSSASGTLDVTLDIERLGSIDSIPLLELRL
jgi:hypothetical protein